MVRRVLGRVGPGLFLNVLGPIDGEMLPHILQRLESVMPLHREGNG